MNQTNYIIRGTLLFDFMGMLTRAAGFYYKIFLSRTIGAAEIGLFQMAVPVFTFCSALCGGGIQTAVSHFAAEYRAQKNERGMKLVLLTGLLLSLLLSFVCMAVLYLNADFIAKRFLLEELCTELIKILAFSLPFCMIHSCICGYFMGSKQVLPPALAQAVEQFIRIFFVLLLYILTQKNGRQSDAKIMALGQLAGEAASAIYCFLCFRLTAIGTRPRPGIFFQILRKEIFAYIRKILSVSFPLSLNRMMMSVLQAIEAALLPQILQQTGLTQNEAVSVYGTLTGMSMPMILFPTALTSALSMLLLPAVSEEHALHHRKQIANTVNASFLGSLLLGSFFLGAFLLFGEDVGTAVFHSEQAGIYIRRLALICPLIYINTTMLSILHGIGKTSSLLLWHLIGFALRLFAIIQLVPLWGINGYLCGMLADQFLMSAFILFTLRHTGLLTAAVSSSVTRMLLPAIAGGSAALPLLNLCRSLLSAPTFLFLCGTAYCILFLLTALLVNPELHFF
ncbi:MAG: polysaccharide biosynthesis protein [Lachnospiraceae bacterium]|nr:polysaccharide biosynthesis protein [Lachnospiraceae bacterium]